MKDNRVQITTLCYIEKDEKYLMMHRVKKEFDQSKDKWLGLGGHFEAGESPEECLLREVMEESSLTLTSYRLRGHITFVSDEYGTEYMWLFTADGFTGEIGECSEGELYWIPKADVYDLPIWEGDKVFLKMLEERDDFFTLKLRYEGEKLVEVKVDGNWVV